MSELLSLPYQLLVDGVVSQLDTKSLVVLRQVSHSTKQLVDDELVWRRKIMEDFNFPMLSSARVSGWQKLYRGLGNPQLYTWGEWSNGRIGRPLDSTTLPAHVWNVLARARGVPFPLNIDWHRAQAYYDGTEAWEDDIETEQIPYRLVQPVKTLQGIPIQLFAGGYSFFALTTTGRILAWGSSSPMSFSGNVTSFETPTLLHPHGGEVKSLTVGREHLTALTKRGRILERDGRWDRPIFLDIPQLFGLAPSTSVKILQVEAGWDFTSILAEVEGTTTTASSSSSSSTPSSSTRIVFWKTAWTRMWREKLLRPQYRSEDPGIWSAPILEMDGIPLPLLPNAVQQIAAGDNFMLALTKDHIVFYTTIPPLDDRIEGQIAEMLRRPDDIPRGRNNDNHDDDDDEDDNSSEEEYLSNDDPRRQATWEKNERDMQKIMNQIVSFYKQKIRVGEMQWRKLDQFCDNLRPSDGKEVVDDIWDQEVYSHLVNSHTKITHISAHFLHFAVYAPEAGENSGKGKSKGIVILGKSDSPSIPIIIPELQGQQVIKVTHGDWHSGALTQDGRVLTWGQKSSGALGNWDALPHPENAISTLQASSITSTMIRMGVRSARGAFRAIRPEVTRPAEAEQSINDDENDYMVDAERDRYRLRAMPENVESPLPVRFGFPRLGEEYKGHRVEANDTRETKYVFDLAFAGWHSGALAIDRSLLSE